MTAPTNTSRQSEAQQTIRNCLQRLDKLLEQRHPDLLQRAQKNAGLSDTDQLTVSQLDKILLYVRQEIPSITLELFSTLSLMDLGLVGYAAANADTVGDALRLTNNYHELTTERFRPMVEVGTEKAHIVAFALPDFANQFIDIAEDNLAGTWNMLRQLLGTRAKSTQITVNLAYPPPSYHLLYKDIFGKDIHFNAERTELVFPSHWLTLPVSKANPEIAELYSALCERLLGPTTTGTDTIASIRALLLTRQGRIMPSVGSAAQTLNLATEQLRKRLWRQGTSYKALVLEARMVLGKHYLEATNFSIQEIAYLLDYSHASAFSRAFKTYYGFAPVACREP